MEYTVVIEYKGFWDNPCEARFNIISEEWADVVAEKAILALIGAASVQEIESIEVKYFDEDRHEWIYPYIKPIKNTAFYRSLELTPPEMEMNITIYKREQD
jgi:hypothetical protein